MVFLTCVVSMKKVPGYGDLDNCRSYVKWSLQHPVPAGTPLLRLQ